MDEQSIAALQRPPAWPHPVSSVELIETHISWVLLTGEYAYKIKKPVNFGFLDFSSLDKRQHCCEEEVRLNRRLAPQVYLDVVPICGEPGAPVVDGDGPVLDYAVRMCQFDTQQGFDRLLQRGELDGTHIKRVATILADFHDSAEHAAPDSGFGTSAAVYVPVQENFDQIRPNLDQQVEDPRIRDLFATLEDWSQEASRQLKNVFNQRLADGLVRECHGDLHLRNIVYWRGEIIPFDCIEFNPGLRWIDVMSELAFFLMDLDDHGRSDLAGRLLNDYLQLTGDYQGLQVLRFYQVYRALVRAKVASLRLAQSPANALEETADLIKYLELADAYTRPGTAKLAIAHGLSGSGKTWVSDQLLEHSEIVRLRSDVERKRMHGLKVLEKSGSADTADIYTPEATGKTYAMLLELATQLTGWGYAVLVDAAFLKAAERDTFRRLAQGSGIPFAIMHCVTEPDVQRQRVERRSKRADDASEADLAVLDMQQRNQEPLSQAELDEVISIDTTHQPALEEMLDFLES